MPHSNGDHSVVSGAVDNAAAVPEVSGGDSPIQIWGNDAFQAMQNNFKEVFKKDFSGEDSSVDDILPKFDLEKKSPALDLDRMAEKLSYADELAGSPVGRMLSEAVSDASARGQGAVDELVRDLNKRLGAEDLSVKVSPGDPDRRPISSYNITLFDENKGRDRGSVVADGRGRK